ncbi:MAG: DUF790 family protein [Calditrichaeota bacterium]|nr:MAG: DUF790 family protein [Calditrichota bacterium]
MLTKDLLRFKISRGVIIPQFINPDDPALLQFAGQLLAVFKAAVGTATRAELLQESQALVETAPCPAIIARGLEKLLLDRTEFDTTPDPSLMEWRQELFRRTGEWLSQMSFATYEDYLREIEREWGEPPETLAHRLYADLPESQPVIRFRALSPRRLLHRYNCAQVQGLLLRCAELHLRVADSGSPQLRQLFKYLRFHQLLARIQKNQAGEFIITVDGPLNLFYKTQKYGLNLARFFPAVLHQPRWALEAEVQFRGRRKQRLVLDHTCGLEPYSEQFLAYVPEEIRMFQENFQTKVADWQMEPAAEFVPLEGEYYCFPDFVLTHASGCTVALELFHPWHAAHLTARLQQLEGAATPTLILGVSRILLKDTAVAAAVENSPYFARFGFTFREMPTVEGIKKVLEQVLQESKS